MGMGSSSSGVDVVGYHCPVIIPGSKSTFYPFRNHNFQLFPEQIVRSHLVVLIELVVIAVLYELPSSGVVLLGILEVLNLFVEHASVIVVLRLLLVQLNGPIKVLSSISVFLNLLVNSTSKVVIFSLFFVELYGLYGVFQG